MKKILILATYLIISLSLYSQAVVIDATRQASDVAIGSEEQAEEEVQKTALEKIQEFSKKTQSIMDSVKVYMNTATSYIQGAKQVYKAGETIYKTAENYKEYVKYIEDNKNLTTDQKLAYIQSMSNKVQQILDIYNKIQDISGNNSKGLSKSEQSQKEGKMKDGERLRLINRYASDIDAIASSLENVFSDVKNYEKRSEQKKILNNYSRNAMFFKF